MKRGFLALLVSLIARIGASMLLFVLIAREWGALRFGEFMYLFSVAAVLVLVCEFGFTQQILRDIGRNPDSAAEQMGAFLGAKIWLTLLDLIFVVLFFLFSGLNPASGVLLGLLFVAAALVSYSDFLFACYRALGRYEWETIVTVQGNILYFIAGALALYLSESAILLASALVLARALQLGLSTRKFCLLIDTPVRPSLDPRSAANVIRRSLPFGADVAAAAIYVNADALIITHVLGYAANGVYQAAARFYQGACQLPPIFASLFLPRMARDQGEIKQLSAHMKQLYGVMIVTGVLLLAVFFVMPYGIKYIYHDPSLLAAGALFPWFGLLLCIRFIAAAQGISVTVMNGQTIRVLLTGVSLLVMVLLAVPLLEYVGTRGVILASIIAYLFLSCSFWYWTRRKGVVVPRFLASAHLGFLAIAAAYASYTH